MNQEDQRAKIALKILENMIEKNIPNLFDSNSRNDPIFKNILKIPHPKIVTIIENLIEAGIIDPFKSFSRNDSIFSLQLKTEYYSTNRILEKLTKSAGDEGNGVS